MWLSRKWSSPTKLYAMNHPEMIIGPETMNWTNQWAVNHLSLRNGIVRENLAIKIPSQAMSSWVSMTINGTKNVD